MERNENKKMILLLYDDFCAAVMCLSLIGLLGVLLVNHWPGNEHVMMLQRKFPTLKSKKVFEH